MPNNPTPTPPIQASANTSSSVVTGASTITTVTENGVTYSVTTYANGEVSRLALTTIGQKNSADTYVYGVNHPMGTSTFEFSPVEPEGFPDPKLLIDNRNRSLTTLTEYTGRSTITVVGKNQNERIFQTIEFFVTGMNLEQTESYSIQKNNLGFTFYSFDSNPASLTLSGVFLNGRDFSSRFAFRSSLRNKILDTNWFNRFLAEYKEVFSSSKAIENDLRVFFAIENITFEVFIVGYSTAMESTMPTLPAFKLNMIVKKMIPRNVKEEDLNLVHRQLLTATLVDKQTGDVTTVNLSDVNIENNNQTFSSTFDFPPGDITTNGGVPTDLAATNTGVIASLNTTVKS